MGFHSKLVALAVLSPATLVQAIATFAITNIDDIVVLAVMFGQAPGHRGAAIRVTAGQYLGFTAILAVSVGGALLGATLLPPAALPYFGLLPIVLGLRAAWLAWRDRRTQPAPTDDPATLLTPGTWQVAVITFANGGDNIGVYVPIFAVSTIATIGVYIIVFDFRGANLTGARLTDILIEKTRWDGAVLTGSHISIQGGSYQL